MRPYLDCDPTPRQAAKPLLHPFLGRRHRAFSHHLAFTVHHIVVARLVAQVHSDRQRSFADSFPLRTLRTSVILLHGRFSFCTSSAFPIGSLSHPAGGRPSHSISVMSFRTATVRESVP